MDDAIKRGEVVNVHGHIYNYSNFKAFIRNVEEQKVDTIRITNYTIEGDPIFYVLNFDGTKINMEIDKSKDKHRGNGPSKINVSCQQIVATEGNVKYILKDCVENVEYENFELLLVSEIKD